MSKSNRFAHISSNTSSLSKPTTIKPSAADFARSPLKQLGWQAFFQQQLTLNELSECTIARISAHHRTHFDVIYEQGEAKFAIASHQAEMTVGDWVLLDNNQQFIRRLERSSLFSRKAAGSKIEAQLIAANIDYVFIVSSLNQDFNVNRIERYLSLVNEAGVTPIIVLTKSDLCDDIQFYIEQITALDPLLIVESVNGLDPQSTGKLAHFCASGKTVAFIGSSGVGKSTLVNSLLRCENQATSAIREDDSKGRHTTTTRSLHMLADGGLLLDTPGMRELQLASCEQGVNETFSDIVSLAKRCRFSDCQHQAEPNCAVQKAITKGEITERRLLSYQKLLREQALNGASIAERRTQDKALGKMYKRIQGEAKAHKRGG